MRHYFDASALVKRFKVERGQQTIRELLVEVSRGIQEVVTLDWSRAEFCVAMRKVGVPRPIALRNLRLLTQITNFAPITKAIVDGSIAAIFDLRLHAADAVHLSACLKLDCSTLVSDDEDLTKDTVKNYLKKQGVRLLNLSTVS